MGIGNPTTQRAGTCTLGHLPEYVIMAKTKEHIKAGVDFARENNIRLLIRNTGHGTFTSIFYASISNVLVDFMGRSAGFGSLAINTHSFKTVTFVKNYTGPGNYTGSAVTVGAGIQVRELYRLANQQNPKVVVVGGECPTVGLAGGYIQVFAIPVALVWRMCLTKGRVADMGQWLRIMAWVSGTHLS